MKQSVHTLLTLPHTYTHTHTHLTAKASPTSPVDPLKLPGSPQRETTDKLMERWRKGGRADERRGLLIKDQSKEERQGENVFVCVCVCVCVGGWWCWWGSRWWKKTRLRVKDKVQMQQSSPLKLKHSQTLTHKMYAIKWLIYFIACSFFSTDHSAFANFIN